MFIAGEMFHKYHAIGEIHKVGLRFKDVKPFTTNLLLLTTKVKICQPKSNQKTARPTAYPARKKKKKGNTPTANLPPKLPHNHPKYVHLRKDIFACKFKIKNAHLMGN